MGHFDIVARNEVVFLHSRSAFAVAHHSLGRGQDLFLHHTRGEAG